jgi:predicted  nucleic acid-binding Zn-ribbon protein
MLKKLIAPLQVALLQKKLCPGCTRSLDEQLNRITRINQTEQVECECGRIYIYDKQLEIYRRALDNEVKY